MCHFFKVLLLQLRVGVGGGEKLDWVYIRVTCEKVLVVRKQCMVERAIDQNVISEKKGNIVERDFLVAKQ